MSATTSSLSRLLNPRSVALIGASERSTFSRMAYENLTLLGFEGQVHLVARGGGVVHGAQTVISVAAVAGPIDVAVLMVPNAAILETLRDLGAARVPYAIVLAGGFAETGHEGALLQAEMVGVAQSLGITLLGPNSLGFINFGTGAICWTGSLRRPLLKGGISVVSQSGAVCTVLMNITHQHGIGLNLVSAVGNECMLGLGEVMQHLADDPATRVIALFIETVRDPRRFRAAAERALRAGKPIVVLKVGRSEVAMRAAQSHTGALVGDDAVFDGVCRQLGVVRVDSLEELVFTAAVMEKTGVLPQVGVAVMSVSGGMGELAADHAQAQGLRLAELSAETIAGLRALLPPMATPSNPLDLTGAAVNNPDLFRQCLEVMQRDADVSQLLCVYDVPTGLDGDWSPFAVGTLEALGKFRPDGRSRALIVSNTVKYVSQKSREEIARRQLPYLACGLDHALRAMKHAQRWSQRRSLVDGGASSGTAARPVLARPAALPASEREAMDYLRACGVPVVPQMLAADATQAVAAARQLDGAVVLKIASPHIAHKTEVGGVALHLRGDDAVAAAFQQIMQSAKAGAPQARLDGVVVSPMRPGGVELFVGVRLDAQWGPVLALGLGGVWIEALKDVSLRPLPVSAGEVLEMLGELRGKQLLQGFRGAAAVDLPKLAEVVSRIGDAALALGPALDTLEVNPLLADGSRIEALDALVTSTSSRGQER